MHDHRVRRDVKRTALDKLRKLQSRGPSTPWAVESDGDVVSSNGEAVIRDGRVHEELAKWLVDVVNVIPDVVAEMSEMERLRARVAELEAELEDVRPAVGHVVCVAKEFDLEIADDLSVGGRSLLAGQSLYHCAASFRRERDALRARVAQFEDQLEGAGKDRYFVYVGDGSFEFCATQAEARKCAIYAIAEYADECDPCWPTEVENVMWGVVMERATEVRLDAEPPDGCDYASTFELRPMHDERREGE